jgi:hypothetical protein
MLEVRVLSPAVIQTLVIKFKVKISGNSEDSKDGKIENQAFSTSDEVQKNPLLFGFDNGRFLSDNPPTTPANHRCWHASLFPVCPRCSPRLPRIRLRLRRPHRSNRHRRPNPIRVKPHGKVRTVSLSLVAAVVTLLLVPVVVTAARPVGCYWF